jgi:uncharacterized protein (DUF58 family)
MKRQWGQLFDSDFLAQLDRLAVASKRAVHSPRTGGRRSHRLGDGLEFADHRDYAPGDNVRFVDWRYFARMDRLLTRLFHEHREGGVAILLDRSASMAGPDGGGQERSVFWTRALRVAAILGYVSIAGHERLWLCGYAEELNGPLGTSNRREDMPSVLDALAGMTPSGKADLSAATRRFMSLPDRPSAVIIISDLLDVGEGFDEAMAMLALGDCDVSVLHATDHTWTEQVGLGPVEFIDAESQDTLSLTVTSTMLEHYHREQAALGESCRRIAQARGVTYVEAPLDEPLDELVLLGLRRGGVLVAQ